MRRTSLFGLAPVFVLALASTGQAATISGLVKGPDGKPFMGAFVVAHDAQKHMSIDVLSDAQGRYHVNLPAATYDFSIRAIGYAADPRSDVKVTEDEKTASFDFALAKAPVSWGDLTTYQGRVLLPHTKTHDLSHKDPFFVTCFESCHAFQHRMVPLKLDAAGWLQLVQFMRHVMGANVSDQRAKDFASYLAVAFGPKSPKPASPDEDPRYQSLVRRFSPQAMNIGYVEYDFPADAGMGPWSAVQDKTGMMWSPYYGLGNAVVRLDPKTGVFKKFPLPPNTISDGVHSAIPGSDGNVWFSELHVARLGKLDPKTGKVTEYPMPRLPDGRQTTSHTVLMDQEGRVWTTGGPAISMFNPKTETFKHYDVAGTYGVELAPNGDVWFTDFVLNGPIVRITKDGVLSKFYPPTKGKPQRLFLDKQGNVWFSERQGNKIGRFDPKTNAFKEYPLPGPEASPYAIGVDRQGMIWYSSHEQDTLNRLNPKTGAVVEYPFPQSEISMRDFFMDAQGHLWFASSANSKVGYFFNNGPNADPVN